MSKEDKRGTRRKVPRTGSKIDSNETKREEKEQSVKEENSESSKGKIF